MKLVQIDASKGKAQIFKAFATQFAFPEHFGQNWDALDECFAEAVAAISGDVRVHIATRQADPEDLSILGSIMAQAAQEHSHLTVTFDHGAKPSQPTKVA